MPIGRDAGGVGVVAGLGDARGASGAWSAAASRNTAVSSSPRERRSRARFRSVVHCWTHPPVRVPVLEQVAVAVECLGDPTGGGADGEEADRGDALEECRPALAAERDRPLVVLLGSFRAAGRARRSRRRHMSGTPGGSARPRRRRADRSPPSPRRDLRRRHVRERRRRGSGPAGWHVLPASVPWATASSRSPRLSAASASAARQRQAPPPPSSRPRRASRSARSSSPRDQAWPAAMPATEAASGWVSVIGIVGELQCPVPHLGEIAPARRRHRRRRRGARRRRADLAPDQPPRGTEIGDLAAKQRVGLAFVVGVDGLVEPGRPGASAHCRNRSVAASVLAFGVQPVVRRTSGSCRASGSGP